MGLLVGFIASLQIKNNRMFLLEGKTDLDCNWSPIEGLSCSNLTIVSIILFLVIGFIIGGLVQGKNNKK